MGEKTGIEWTDSTWTPIRARLLNRDVAVNRPVGSVGWHCEHVSEACRNCYAETINRRLGAGLNFKPGHRKDIEIFLDEAMLTKPLHWRKPRKIFVCSMTDLFADFVKDEWIDRMFAVMALCPQHTFQCLTKRPERMRAYFSCADVTQRIAKAMDSISVDCEHCEKKIWASVPDWPYEASTHGRVRRDGLILQQIPNPISSRASVTLWLENEPTTFFVHTLVLLAHRGAAPEGLEACHRNGNEQDNRLANLRWGSRTENQREKVRHGANGGPAKITREQAAEIRSLRKAGGMTQQAIADKYGVSRSLISMIESRAVWPDAFSLPLPNVWLGTSCEDQATADERIPHLLATPAAIRFLSCEPMLGPLDLRHVAPTDSGYINALSSSTGPNIDWAIVGGESGPNARPMHPDWARSLRDQCVEAGVPYFFKQWGEHGRVGDQQPAPDHLPEDVDRMTRVGKKRAGRLLDGVEHNGFPG
jgi:protein gp37